jgi:hypothetical protein
MVILPYFDNAKLTLLSRLQVIAWSTTVKPAARILVINEACKQTVAHGSFVFLIFSKPNFISTVPKKRFNRESVWCRTVKISLPYLDGRYASAYPDVYHA